MRAVRAIRAQLDLFCLCLGFLTRIPMPRGLPYSPRLLNESARYMPLVGWLVGAVAALSFLLFSAVCAPPTAILLSMVTTVLLTGAFHEDGLADTADGLGGGWTPETKLEIMKDSRLGSYGAVALVLAMLLKFQALAAQANVALALLVAHPLSRLVAVSMIPLSRYVRPAATSKVKPLASAMSSGSTLVATATGLAALLFVPRHAPALLLGLFALLLVARTFLHRQLGGFTGDTLGALQQTAELAVYLVLATGRG